MVAEALVAANPVFKFEEVIYDPVRYQRLMHDDLLCVIKKSKNPELHQSAQLLKRIDRRDLYKCVRESIVNQDKK